jgi:hypothetical protein
MIKWAHAAGLVRSEAQFEDVYGLDSEVSSSFMIQRTSALFDYDP